MNNTTEITDHPRLRVLIDRFHKIDEEMRYLPIHNPKVAIEAIGFRPFGDDALLGVLITPWFMNLILLPVAATPIDMTAIGKTVLVDLPAGKRLFAANGDIVTGLYQAHSLHSPMSIFTLPGQAAAEARRILALVMTPEFPEAEPAEPQPAEPGPAKAASARPSGAGGIDRRAWLLHWRRK